MRMVGRELGYVVVCWLLAACGEASRDPRPGSPPELPEPPALSPRWAALSSWERLRVVRFDDVTRPQEVVLSARADGEQVDSAQVFWSPSGEHVAFVTRDEQGTASLWLASATDGFLRRSVAEPESTLSDWGPGPSQRALFWIGSDTFVLRVPSETGISFFRVSTATLSPVLLGSFANEPGELGGAWSNVLSAASAAAGFLFSAGSRSQPELYFAGETGSARRLGTALLANGDGVHYASAELVWSPDGQSANFWSTAVPSSSAALPSSGQIGLYSIADAEAPALELAAENRPAIGLVHLPQNLVIDAHPHGNLGFTEEIGGRAQADTGGAVAYTLHHSQRADSYRLLFGVPSGASGLGGAIQIEGGIGRSLPVQFGFLGAATLYYPEFVPANDAAVEPRVRCMLWRDGEERELSVGRYTPATFRAIAGTELLYFVREDPARHAELFRVDVADGSARALPVPLVGSVLLDSALPQGRSFGPGLGMFGGSDAGTGLLISTSTAEECRYLGHQCETARWVVELSSDRAATRLDARWLAASLSWAADGSGLLALAPDGFYFLPGPSYEGSFLLSENVGTLIAPDRWPAP